MGQVRREPCKAGLKMKHIVGAIDFSAISRDVVELAASLATTYGAPLSLVHVAAPDPFLVGYDVGRPAEELREGHQQLHRMADELRARGLNVTPLLIQGPTIEKLLEEVKRLKADLLVVGSHGRGALSATLVGSVSASVLRHAPCPVLVVPFHKDDPGSA